MLMPKATTRLPQKYIFALVLLPVLLVAALIYTKSVNVPFWDEWELVPIFQHLHGGHFFWLDFWQQHNEHRLLFPTTALVSLAYLTHWNLQVECAVNLAVAIASFLLLKSIAFKSAASKREALLLFLLALVWFSPVQVENWLWGWQLEWFMNVLGVMIFAFGLARIKGKRLSRGNLALVLGGGIIAQYSLGNGTLVWPIALAALIYMGVVLRDVLIVGLTGVLTTFLYYFHYVNPPGGPSKTLALKEPLRFGEYVIGYLGRPLSNSHRPALAIGLLLLTVFAALSIYLLVCHKAVFRQCVPWAALGLYAIGSAMITGLARLGFGVPEAYSSRYTTISSLLLVSVIMLCWQSRGVLRKFSAGTYRVAMPIMVLALFCLVGIEWGWGFHAADTQHAKLATIHQCSSVPQPTADCLLLTYPSAAAVTPRLQFIKSQHWGGY